jgi:hypothetical protein
LPFGLSDSIVGYGVRIRIGDVPPARRKVKRDLEHPDFWPTIWERQIIEGYWKGKTTNDTGPFN